MLFVILTLAGTVPWRESFPSPSAENTTQQGVPEAGEVTALDGEGLCGRRLLTFLLVFIVLFCSLLLSWVCHGTPEVVRGQLSGSGSLLSCGFQESNSGHQVCQCGQLSHIPGLHLLVF